MTESSVKSSKRIKYKETIKLKAGEDSGTDRRTEDL